MPRHAVTAILLAAAVGLGASACGAGDDEISKSKVSKQIQQETGLQKLADAERKKFAECLADAVVKHGNKTDVKAYVDGKKQAKDIRGMQSEPAKAAVNACIAAVRK